MAIRQLREIGDDILTKQCKAVPKMTLRTKILIGICWRQCTNIMEWVLPLPR